MIFIEPQRDWIVAIVPFVVEQELWLTAEMAIKLIHLFYVLIIGRNVSLSQSLTCAIDAGRMLSEGLIFTLFDCFFIFCCISDLTVCNNSFSNHAYRSNSGFNISYGT